MDNTMQLSMTEIELQFESIDDFSQPTGMYEMESEVIPDTAVIEMRFSQPAEEKDPQAAEIARRQRGLPDGFGGDLDLDSDHYFDD